jgi:hypothetical protein
MAFSYSFQNLKGLSLAFQPLREFLLLFLHGGPIWMKIIKHHWGISILGLCGALTME